MTDANEVLPGNAEERPVYTMWDSTANDLWGVIAEVRDASPRLPNDADTNDIIDAIAPDVDIYARRYAAQVLRKLAEDQLAQENAHAVWRAIGRRADELDPPA